MAAGKKMIKAPKVKNKAPAPIQITAEQILRESKERFASTPIAPKRIITDPEEIDENRQLKRKGFEDAIRRNRTHIGTWIKYAAWEDSQGEIARARSVYERALDVDPKNITLWLKYAEMEMKNKNVNLAKNVWNRAVTILPRVDQFWYKFAYMEEVLGNVDGAREIYERWLEWDPPDTIWASYIKLERRYNEIGRARALFKRFVKLNPTTKNWIKYAKFEEEIKDFSQARSVFEAAIDYQAKENEQDPKIYSQFAKFETRLREIDRARIIYKYALNHFPASKTESLLIAYTNFEKQFGNQSQIQDLILNKRRDEYELKIKNNPKNYDTWFDYIKLEESIGDIGCIRELYERAIAEVPPISQKRYWRRYIYLWIYYATFEELFAKDKERAHAVYKACLKVIPHKIFTFAKVWRLYCQFLVRMDELNTARKTFGIAIGAYPKDRIFKDYIDLELNLREFDRCRTIYERHLLFKPFSCSTWIKFAELERLLGDSERARALFEIAITQEILDMPELLWKSYIDFEYEEGEYENARALYERLLTKTEHVKVWISNANFEILILQQQQQQDLKDDENSEIKNRVIKIRELFQRGYDSLKRQQLKEERVVLLEAWIDFELNVALDEATAATIKLKLPKKVKKRRRIQIQTNENQLSSVKGVASTPLTATPIGTFPKETVAVGWEEYWDYLFPEDLSEQPQLKLIALAHQWRNSQVSSNQESNK